MIERRRGPDIVKRLEETLLGAMRPGTANSDVNVYALPIEVATGHLYQAIDEIKRLRGIIRSCQHGAEVVDLGDGEMIGLHLPNKEK